MRPDPGSAQPGLTDASRNCISNVRTAGLSVAAVAANLHQLLSQSRVRQLTGAGLEDDADDHAMSIGSEQAGNFLLGPSVAG